MGPGSGISSGSNKNIEYFTATDSNKSNSNSNYLSEKMSEKSVSSISGKTASSSRTDSAFGDRNKEKKTRQKSRNFDIGREEKEKEKERTRLRDLEREKERDELDMQKLVRTARLSRERAEAAMTPDENVLNILRVSFKCQSFNSTNKNIF